MQPPSVGLGPGGGGINTLPFSSTHSQVLQPYGLRPNLNVVPSGHRAHIGSAQCSGDSGGFVSCCPSVECRKRHTHTTWNGKLILFYCSKNNLLI